MSGSEGQSTGDGGTASDHPVPAPPQPPKRPLQLNFKNHCFLCLQPQPFQTLLELARRNPKRIKSFQPILNYLTGTDPTHDRGKEECKRRGIPVMGTLPPVCLSCYDILAEVNRLHEQLLNVQWLIQKQVEVARKVVGGALVPVHQSSKEEGSEEVPQQFPFRSSIMASGLSEEGVAAVLKVVNDLHRRVAGAGTTKVIFPVSTPQDFTPTPTPTPVCVTIQTLQAKAKPSENAAGKPPSKTSGTSGAGVIPIKQEIISEDPSSSASYSGDQSSDTKLLSSSSGAISFCNPMTELNMDAQTPTRSSSLPPPAKRSKLVKKEGVRRRRPRGHPDAVGRPKTIRKFVNGVSTAQRCDLCGKLIPFTEMLKHLQSHVKNNIVSCPRAGCPYLFSCTGKLNKHLYKKVAACRKDTTISPDHFNNVCDTCGFETKNFHEFRSHILKHELVMKEKLLCCPLPECLERFALRQSVDDHIYTHDLRTPISEQECSLCKQQMQIEDLPQHFRDAHQIETHVSCKRCPLIFHDWVPLLDHFYEHRGRGGTTCDICKDGVKLIQYTSLRQHFYHQHNIGKPLICELCNKELFSQKSLSFHLKTKHSEMKKEVHYSRLKCELCPDQLFRNRDVFITHNIKFHGADPLTCAFCSKEFMNASTLRTHETQHTGSVPRSRSKTITFTCQEENCGRQFSRRKGLKNHVERVHLGKIPPRSVCDICGESFSCRTTLKHHKLIHTGERPHLCPVCGQAFRTRSVMQIHVKGHERGEGFKPNGEMKHIRKRVARNE